LCRQSANWDVQYRSVDWKGFPLLTGPYSLERYFIRELERPCLSDGETASCSTTKTVFKKPFTQSSHNWRQKDWYKSRPFQIATDTVDAIISPSLWSLISSRCCLLTVKMKVSDCTHTMSKQSNDLFFSNQNIGKLG